MSTAVTTSTDNVMPLPIAGGEELKSAFAMFNQMSQQLAESYGLLERQVAELNSELNTVSAQRLEELAEKERLAQRLESLLNVLPGGVVVLDARGYIAECNPAALDMLGEPLEGLLWREVIERSFAPQVDDGHEVSTRDGRRISIATRSLGEDGQIILLTDQTETRRLQAQLSRHERLSAMGKMVSSLAHQIRTPLSAAMLYAGHLQGNQLDEGKREQFTRKLANRLNNMERQVQDMLLFARGELPIDECCSIAELQQTLAEEMEVQLDKYSAECQWRVEGEAAELDCNREALVGALLNLVNNALEAAGEGCQLQINFLCPQQNLLLIQVVDFAGGMNAEQLAAVQEQFVTTKSQGTGLGLSVVQAVASAHGGHFELQSQPGEGSCANLFLPLKNSATAQAGGDQS